MGAIVTIKSNGQDLSKLLGQIKSEIEKMTKEPVTISISSRIKSNGKSAGK